MTNTPTTSPAHTHLGRHPRRGNPLVRLESLGLQAADRDDLIRQVERGFPFAALQSLGTRSGIGLAQLAAVVGIPQRTLARRKSSRKLSWEESERLLRVAKTFQRAVDLFEGDVQAAVSWLTTPRKILNDQAPLSYSRTEIGAREVENLMGRMEHGVFS
jgi:putative toxin-antitoxin system antitoxin component (TIGR02293 family)